MRGDACGEAWGEEGADREAKAERVMRTGQRLLNELTLRSGRGSSSVDVVVLVIGGVVLVRTPPADVLVVLILTTVLLLCC